MYVCVCVCVIERVREESNACLCVCLCDREREKRETFTTSTHICGKSKISAHVGIDGYHERPKAYEIFSFWHQRNFLGFGGKLGTNGYEVLGLAESWVPMGIMS